MKKFAIFVIVLCFVGGAYAESYVSKEILRVKWGNEDGQIGLYFGGPEPTYEFPKDMAIDRNGNIYISDYVNQRIVKFDNSGKFVGNYGKTYGGINDNTYYENIAIDGSDNVYSFDAHNRNIVKYDPQGKVKDVIGEKEGESELMMGVNKNGDIYVDNHKKTEKFAKKQSMGIFGLGAREEYAPVDSDFAYESPGGNVYILKRGGARTKLMKFGKTSQGMVVSGAAEKNADNVEASFNANKGDSFIGFDDQDNYYVADFNYTSIRKYDVDGNLIQQIGLPKNPGISGYLFRLVKVDPKGDIYNFLYDDKEAWVVKMEKVSE